MNKVEWKNTDFIGDIIACIPDLGKSFQAASFYRPPDSPPNGFALSLLNNFPFDYDDVAWQVNFSIIPQLNQWFEKVKGKKFPPITNSDEEAYKIGQKYESILFQTRQLFSITAFLAVLGQFVPYGKVTLKLLSDEDWGEIVNTAANAGLLFLGENKLSPASLLNIFGHITIDLTKNWNDYSPRRLKHYRFYDPYEELPLLYLKQIFVNLRHLMSKEDSLMMSLLSYAREKDEDEMSSEILRLALDLDLFMPFTVTGFIEHCKLPGSDFHYFEKAAKNTFLRDNFPELVKDIEDRNQYYIERYKEDL